LCVSLAVAEKTGFLGKDGKHRNHVIVPGEKRKPRFPTLKNKFGKGHQRKLRNDNSRKAPAQKGRRRSKLKQYHSGRAAQEKSRDVTRKPRDGNLPLRKRRRG